MSIRGFNKVAIRFFKQLLLRRNPKLAFVTQKLTENVLKRIAPNNIAVPSRLPQLRRVLLRGFQRMARQRAAPYLRPFATFHFHRQHIRELDRSRRNGFLLNSTGEQKRNVLQRVRHIFGTNVRYNQSLAVTKMPESLDGYEIGNHIACGCSGAVYELKLDQKMERDENQPQMSAFSRYPLALKLMFNYDYGASDAVLCRLMGPELIPLATLPSSLLGGGKMANLKTLPRNHPNLIKIHTAFIDRMVILPGAELLYPDALPTSDDFQFGNPKTLFVVMKRYQMTLHEYVTTRKRNYWTGRVMFGQLLEAIVYLHQNRISHRDMKSDNILLDFNHDEEAPHLVLSDFGCALATGSWIVQNSGEDTDLGGNLALRAPEVRRTRCGPGRVVDFEMADTWSAATMAYEIFTRRNPFYAVLSSENYTEQDLPPLPSRLIGPIRRVICQMLRVNPEERPRPEVAANVLAISLFRFGRDLREFLRSCGLHWYWSMANMRSTFANVREQMDKKIQDITELYATETILARFINPTVISSAELQLRATFLSRVDTDELRAALEYFLDHKQQKQALGGGDRTNGFFPSGFWSESTTSTEPFSSTECL